VRAETKLLRSGSDRQFTGDGRENEFPVEQSFADSLIRFHVPNSRAARGAIWRNAMTLTGNGHDANVGVKLLDRDHDDLGEMIQEIQMRAGNGLDDTRSGEMLRKLAKRLALHFALEDGMMSATRYPGAGVHRLQHQWLMDQVNALAVQRGRNSLARNTQLLSLLTDSHHKHIGHEDFDYGIWLNTGRRHQMDRRFEELLVV
jgi:hemerythrin-like metal-binding protein